jgi:D-psicose/D-tagatose/L-ribulose 3-epimerase
MRFALCNEVLQPMPFAQQCALAWSLGYDSLEVAPFTLAEDPMAITDAQAAALRRTAEDAGVAISGLHWLLVAPAGLSIVSADAGLRDRTTAVMERLVELCALMGGRYLVHGSPKQRSVPAGRHRCSRTRPRTRLPGPRRTARRGLRRHLLHRAAVDARDRPDQHGGRGRGAWCSRSARPRFKTMLDCSAAGQAEAEPVAALMARWMPSGHMAHVQVNDPTAAARGRARWPSGPSCRRCGRCSCGHYRGVVAVEPFDYVPDGPGSAARAIGYLKGVLEGLAADD